MNRQKTKPKRTDNFNFQSLTSISILIAGGIISLGILIPSGVFQKGFISIRSSIPKFPTYQSVKDINEGDKVEDILTAQPKLSFKKGVKFVVIETGDFNCATCAALHTSSTKSPTFYSRFLDDYIETGKVDYMWVDNQTAADIRKHEAMYCVAEQSPKRFFDFKETMYKQYNAGFDIDSIKKEVKSLWLNPETFETCIQSKKYEARVKTLTAFSKETLAVMTNPSLTVYKVNTGTVEKLDGTKENQVMVEKVGTIDPNLDYDVSFKSGFDKLVK
jgi:Thioredoxin